MIELGIVLPPPMPPAGNYLACARDGDLLYVGGHGPVNGATIVRGKVGTDLTLDEAKAAARMTGLSLLASVRAELGSLDRVVQIVKVLGMVNVGGAFNQMPAVIDGCSNLLVEVFGDAGRHTRSAVGMASLPFDIPVEIELIVRVQ